MRPDWENVMDGFMLTALKAKYSQHKDLADLLKGTGTAFLEERTDDDSEKFFLEFLLSICFFFQTLTMAL